MPTRVSGFRGTWEPNKRPYVTLSPDVYVTLQGETSVIACGECRREVNLNDYITGVSTEASVDSAPGSATINLSIPDNDANDFYVDGQFIVVPMMEIEVYAKGYFLVGGFPQYYRIFWGLVQSTTKSWSGGTTQVTISCKDILRWWELTNVTLNPAFLESFGSSAGGYQLWQNQFAGMNPYTTIIHLARESMGDFSLTTGSFLSYIPEKGPENRVVGSYVKDIMTYWQLKFANIWNSLVLYGTSGQAYMFTGGGATVSPIDLDKQIFINEQKAADQNLANSVFKVDPTSSGVAVFKQELNKAGSVEFFQNESQSKLSVAQMCAQQAGFEFYCDTTGDIVFKPPFYNLNVLPNKPVSWVQNFEIIDDSITDSEAEVFTHITSSGNAFGGVMDWGLNDEITTPRTGAFDFHLLRRYGWRRLDYQCEWAGDPRRLFYHLIDWLDRQNAKRQNGTITIPMRPEIRMGFPVWIPKWDSFFYISGISHQFSVGGQATTTLTLMAKRSKFIGPSNIGLIKKNGQVTTQALDLNSPQGKSIQRTEPAYEISFPDRLGSTSGLANSEQNGKPVAIRNPKTGQLLGFPNVVMVYRSTHKGDVLAKILESQGKRQANMPARQNKNVQEGTDFTRDKTQIDVLKGLADDRRADLISRLRAHRYEAAMTNAGAYDYAHDFDGIFKELSIIPTSSVTWGTGTTDPNKSPGTIQITGEGVTGVTPPVLNQDQINQNYQAAIKSQQATVDTAKELFQAAQNDVTYYSKQLAKITSSKTPVANQNADDIKAKLDVAKAGAAKASQDLQAAEDQLAILKANQASNRKIPSLNMIVRPVSDEFGFEVIGHYRYGRTAVIDRGQVKVASDSPGKPYNQLNIQFAATAGILTDSNKTTNSDPTQQNFTALFEQMQPDDYVTGASFTGATQSGAQVSNIQFTSQQTYTNMVNKNTGKTFFVEADALRSATTLGELRPTISIAGLDNATDQCDCGLNRADWLSILPSDFIKSVINSSGNNSQVVPTSIFFGPTAEPGTVAAVDATDTAVGTIAALNLGSGSGFATDTNTNAIVGNASPASFFAQLDIYLRQKFNTDYSANSKREQAATGASRGVVSPLYNAEEQDNVLGDPQNPLFSRAAQGDPAALEALQRGANFNFGMTKQATDTFSKAYQNATQNLGARLESSLNQPVSVASASVQQQPPVPQPSFKSLIVNPTTVPNQNLINQQQPPITPSTPGTITVPPPTKT